MAGEEQDEGYKDLALLAPHELADIRCVGRVNPVRNMSAIPLIDEVAWCPPCRGSFAPEGWGKVDPITTLPPHFKPASNFQAHRAVFVEDGSQGQELRAWWLDTASREVESIIAKAIEYGGEGRALDLIEIGRALHIAGVKIPTQRKAPWPEDKKGMQDADYAELGIYFYLQGKFARWTAAIAEGRPVSDDTLYDIGVYIRMAQRIREVGGWPV